MEEPKNVKHYEILGRLGEGGMGVVYRARDTRLGRDVALKMLPEELAGNEERSRRFEREARIISTLSHPGIATLYDFDFEGETSYLTMELVRGSNLRELLVQGQMPIEDVLECAVQVSDALAAAHRNGVIHRDLKPENIMASEAGYYKILDFGVARLEETDATETPSTQTPTRTWATRAGSLIGTVAYMSPEQILGQPADARSDIFSLGSVLYELVTSGQPFRGPSDIAVAHAIAYESPLPVGETRKDAPAGIGAVLDKCLAKNPEERYQTAEQLSTDLRALRHNTLTGSGVAAKLLANRMPARKSRARITAGIVAALAVTGLAFVGWRMLSTSEVDPAVPSRPAAVAVGRSIDAAAPAPSRSARPRVIVAFFENNTGDPEAEWISRGLPEMLTTDLSDSQGLEVIATQRLHDLLATAGHDPKQGMDRSTTAELARWAGAEVVISGSVFKAGGRFRIDAQAYDTTSGTVITAYKAEGPDLFPVVNDLSTGLLQRLSMTPEAEATASVTSSAPAFQAFVRGRDLYENLGLEEARSEFGDALAADPGFALARLYLAKIHLIDGDVDAALPLLQQALARAEEIPDTERILAQALSSFYGDHDAETATSLLATLVERFPQYGEGYLWWGRALSDLDENPLEATRKLGQALEMDPNDLLATAALADLLARLGATEDARTMLLEARERNPNAGDGIDRLLASY